MLVYYYSLSIGSIGTLQFGSYDSVLVSIQPIALALELHHKVHGTHTYCIHTHALTHTHIHTCNTRTVHAIHVLYMHTAAGLPPLSHGGQWLAEE